MRLCVCWFRARRKFGNSRMNGNGIVFWLEGTKVKYGALVAWKWLPCELAAAEVITPDGTRLDVLAEDIFLSRGAAMKELAAQAGI